jgi:hypothetical protein
VNTKFPKISNPVSTTPTVKTKNKIAHVMERQQQHLKDILGTLQSTR